MHIHEDLKCTFVCFQLRDVWFQHNGAPEHKTSSVKQYLVEKFGEQIIGYGGFQEWPPRSHDLTSMVFFLWDTSNSRRMRYPRQHSRTFNDALRMIVANVATAMLHRVPRQVQARVHMFM
ncbi:hypothetical protein AVEN_178470-1 [Araneus ventricosus]|uniref:DUF4817 domain-containing protein n=1 Tax=Araneus ventricosus TaxID=182803 RepID=A0A4Y2CDN9_ARAVE|nr:hypothetical protein AVEN_178470-1 [Araneus ventricosus]